MRWMNSRQGDKPVRGEGVDQSALGGEKKWRGGLTRTDAAFDHQVASLLGASDIAGKEFCSRARYWAGLRAGVCVVRMRMRAL